MANKPLLIIGGGGHASVLVEVLLEQGREVLGIISPKLSRQREVFDGIPHFMSDDEITKFKIEDVLLVNGIGAVPNSSLREDIDLKFRSMGYCFESVIDKTARISLYTSLGDGVQIMANASIQTGATISRGAIINTGAVVEHDAVIGVNTHIAPGAVLAGSVTVGDGSFIGANAVIIEGVMIGSDVVVGAGVTVLNKIESGTTYIDKSNVVSLSKSKGC